MRRPVLLAVLCFAGFGSAAPALADSTTTQTVPAGASVRSSPDAPTPENPLVVIVRNTCPPGQCPPGDPSVTISLKDARDRSNGPGIEGPSGYVFIGPQVDISTTGAPQHTAVSFEVDASVPLPGNLFAEPFGYAVYRPSQPGGNEFFPYRLVSEQLADGDLRLMPGEGGFTGPGSYDVFESAFFAQASGLDNTLPDARKNGVAVFLKTNFRVEVEWRITVSDSVRRTLGLSSTTIGKKTFARPGGGKRRIPLTLAARRALRKYSKVAVTARAVVRGPRGKVIRDKDAFTLEKPESELG